MKLHNHKLQALKISAGILGFLFCQICVADIAQKKPLQINFNEMIEQSSNERSALENNMDHHYQDDEIDFAEEDSRKVIDFVDVEVQWGDSPQVVDRRFNSLAGETQSVNAPNVEVPRAPQSTTVQVRLESPSLPN